MYLQKEIGKKTFGKLVIFNKILWSSDPPKLSF
jgi:hypothetical protein